MLKTVVFVVYFLYELSICTGGISIARPKKGTYLNVCIETAIYEKLEDYCFDIGQSKTVAVERAWVAYLDAYKQKQNILRNMERERLSAKNPMRSE